ncbi:unnamed protein product [Camellia sinensis]
MGSQILKISPFSSSRTLIFNPTPLSRLLPKSNTPTRFCNTQLRQFSSKPIFINTPISQPGFGLLFRQSERRFRGGVVGMAASGSVQKSDEEWRAILSPEQFRILRKKGTELTELFDGTAAGYYFAKQKLGISYPGTGEYDKLFAEGVYTCAGCGTPLYKSTTKFNSGCGWPAFYEGLPGAINRNEDPDGMRIEITCAACGGHLGHVFKGEGFPTPTDERHCVNSISLKFTSEDSSK